MSSVATKLPEFTLGGLNSLGFYTNSEQLCLGLGSLGDLDAALSRSQQQHVVQATTATSFPLRAVECLQRPVASTIPVS